MLKYVTKRVVAAILTVFALVTIVFFLVRLMPGEPFTSAKLTKERLMKADKFWKEMNSKIEDIPVKPDNSIRILEALYEEPVLNIEKLAKMSGIKSGTMRTVLLDLIDKGFVEQNKTSNKSKIITFRKYIDAFMI